MAAWNANPSCDQPEDSSSLATTANSPGERSFVVRSGRGAAGGVGGAAGGSNAGAGARGRRIGSRGRGTSEQSEAAGGGGGEDRTWSRIGLERRESDAGSRGGAGRGRGRSKKEDVMWVQCDKCLRWRKLALGMRLEDLPDKW